MLSGTVATGIDLAVFQLSLWAGWAIPKAATISFCFAVVVNFILSRLYVYGNVDKQKHLARTQFIFFVLAAFVSLGLTQLMLLILAIHLGLLPILAKILAVPVVFIWTLLAGRYLVFSK